MILGSALNIGGAERVIANLARHLDPGRFKLTVSHLKERGFTGEEIAAEGHDVVGVPRVTSGMSRYLSFRRLAQLIAERDIELVHTHTTYALFDAALCRLFGNRRLKVVHTFHFGNYPHYPAKYRLLERIASRLVNRLIAVGIEQREVIRDTYGLAADSIATIVNGVEPPNAAPDAEWRARIEAEGSIVIGTACTCIEQKGLPDLLATAAIVCREHPRVRFLIVGDGAMRAPMEKRAAEMGLADRVTFAGWKLNAGATMLPLFDIFFQPSLWEAMSMVVLEAMAAGKPVVATRVGDNAHVVKEGVTGYTVPRGDVAGMAAVLGKLVSSPGLRAQFGAAARARFDELYHARSMARAYENLYADVLGGSA